MTGIVTAVAAVIGGILGYLLPPWWDRLGRKQPTPASLTTPRGRLIVAAAMAALWALMAAVFGASWELPAYLYLASVAVPLSLIDYSEKRLPNVFVHPSYLIAGVLLLLPAIAEPDWESYLRAWLGGVALFGLYFLLALIYPKGMGLGDVKLAGVLGLYLGWLGWGPVIVGALAGFFVQALITSFLLVMKLTALRSTYPFGPSMLIGAFIAVVAGQPVAEWFSTAVGG
jgi:leader peptidase (prepilin peptidase)/N-methyltransferase